MQVEILNVSEITPDTKEQLVAFNKLTKEESGVYGVLCPQKTTKTPQEILESEDIPSRIKEIVEMTKGRFYKYEIWEADSYDVKDPIILGREKSKEHPEHAWYDSIYFVGRWGKELETFANLKKMAVDKLVKECKIEVLKMKALIHSRLEDIELFVEAGITAGKTGVPSCSMGVLD
jgi:hypothetical protein